MIKQYKCLKCGGSDVWLSVSNDQIFCRDCYSPLRNGEYKEITMTEHSVKLCAALLSYAVFSSSLTEKMTFSEIKDHVKFFFTDEEIEAAMKIVKGENDDRE